MSPAMEQAVQRVLDAMVQAVDRGERMTVADAAKVGGYSPYHLSRAFSTVVGRSPGEHLARLRYQRAATLLATTDLPIQAVCHRVGYGSPGTFVTNFHRRTGITPGEHRRRARAEVQP